MLYTTNLEQKYYTYKKEPVPNVSTDSVLYEYFIAVIKIIKYEIDIKNPANTSLV